MMVYVCHFILLVLLYCSTVVHGYYWCWESINNGSVSKKVLGGAGSCFYAVQGDLKHPDAVFYSVSGSYGSMACTAGGGAGWINNFQCKNISRNGHRFPAVMVDALYCCCTGWLCNDPRKLAQTWPKWFGNLTTTTAAPTTPAYTGMKSCIKDYGLAECSLTSTKNYPVNCYREFNKLDYMMISSGCDSANYCARNKIPINSCGPGIDKGKIFCCCNTFDNCNDEWLKPSPSQNHGMKSCVDINDKEQECMTYNGWYPANCYNVFDENNKLVTAGCDRIDRCGQYHIQSSYKIPINSCAKGRGYDKRRTYCCCGQYDNCNGRSFKEHSAPTGMSSCLVDDMEHGCALNEDGNYPKNCYNEVYNRKIVSAGCDTNDYCGKNHIPNNQCGSGVEGNIEFCCCNKYDNCNNIKFKPKTLTPKGMKSCLNGNKTNHCTLSYENYPMNCYNEFDKMDYNKRIVSSGCDKENNCGRNSIPINRCGYGKHEYDKGKIFCCCDQFDNCNDRLFKPKTPAPKGMKSCLKGKKANRCILSHGNYPNNCLNEFKEVEYNITILASGCDEKNYCGKNEIPINQCGPGKSKEDKGKIFCCCDQYYNCNKAQFKPKIPTPNGIKSCLDGKKANRCILSHGNYPENCYNAFNKLDYNKTIVSAGCDKENNCGRNEIPINQCGPGKAKHDKGKIFCCCDQHDNCNTHAFKPKSQKPTGMNNCFNGVGKVDQCTAKHGNYPKNCFNEFKLDNKTKVSAGCDKEDYCDRNEIPINQCGPGKYKQDKGKMFCCCNQFDNCNGPSFIPKMPIPIGMKSCLKDGKSYKCSLSHGNFPLHCYTLLKKLANNVTTVSTGCDEKDYCGKNEIPIDQCATDKDDILCCCDQYDNCNNPSFIPKLPTPTGMESCLKDNKLHRCRLSHGNYPKNCYNVFIKLENNITIVESGCDERNYCGRNEIPINMCGSGKDKDEIFCCCDQYNNCNKPLFKPKISTTGMESCWKDDKLHHCSMSHGNYPNNCYNEFEKVEYNITIVASGCDEKKYCGKNEIPINQCGPGKTKEDKGKIFCCCDWYDNCNNAHFKPKPKTPSGMKRCLEDGKERECMLKKGNYPKNCFIEFDKNLTILSNGCDEENLCGNNDIPMNGCGQWNDEEIYCCCNKYDSCNSGSSLIPSTTLQVTATVNTTAHISTAMTTAANKPCMEMSILLMVTVMALLKA